MCSSMHSFLAVGVEIHALFSNSAHTHFAAVAQVMTRVYPAIPSMLSWVQRFLRPQPAQNAKVEVGLGEGLQGGSTIPMCVRQVSCTQPGMRHPVNAVSWPCPSWLRHSSTHDD